MFHIVVLSRFIFSFKVIVAISSCVATGYGLDWRGVRVQVPIRAIFCSSPRRPNRIWVHPASYPMVTGCSLPGGGGGLIGRGQKLTTHLQRVPRSRIIGSIHPLLHTSSWLSASVVKYRDNLLSARLSQFCVITGVFLFHNYSFILRMFHCRVNSISYKSKRTNYILLNAGWYNCLPALKLFRRQKFYFIQKIYEIILPVCLPWLKPFNQVINFNEIWCCHFSSQRSVYRPAFSFLSQITPT
jgi:hypothetical protein